MTYNEETIENLKLLKESAIHSDSSENNKSTWLIDIKPSSFEWVISCAIECLESCEDCISRQAVLDIIHHYKNDRDSQLSDLTDGVCNLPSVQPEQRMGRWVEKLVRSSKALYCSACGNGTDVLYEYDYCPNCGAKMEEGE